MIKYGLVLFACLVMLAALVTNGGQRVEMDLLYQPPFSLPLGLVIMAFFALGVLISVLIALMDRAELTSKNRKLNKQIGRMESELTSLRQMLTMDRDPE